MIKRETFIKFNNSEFETLDYLLGILEDARVTTIQRIKDISTHELHWQYAEGWNTIGILLNHICSIENVFRIEFIEQRKLTIDETERWKPGLEMGKHIPRLITGEPVEVYLQNLEESRHKLIEKLKTISKAEFYKKREGYNPETGYNIAWAMYHIAEDEVHHRGQISILRKLYKLK